MARHWAWWAGGLALALVAAGIPTGAAGHGVSRATPGAADPGKDVTVSLTVDLPDGARSWGIDEVLPAGWTAVSASSGGSLATPGHVKWLKFDAGGVHGETLTYVAQVPAAAGGPATFKGTYQFDGMSSESAITGDDTVQVTGAGQPAHEPATNNKTPGPGAALVAAGLAAMALIVRRRR